MLFVFGAVIMDYYCMSFLVLIVRFVVVHLLVVQIITMSILVLPVAIVVRDYLMQMIIH